MQHMMLQGFEWYLEADGKHWQHLLEQVRSWKDKGIEQVWLPPAYKGHRGLYDSGYGVYDLYDLGEFDQKGSRTTKYGDVETYRSLLALLEETGIDVYVDIVLNHRIGGDALESVAAERINPRHRLHVEAQQSIEAWSRFLFSARQKQYSSFQWHADHFKATDFDQKHQHQGIYRFKGKNWDEDVSLEYDNYDYLMGLDVDFNHPDVHEEIIRWGQWYLDFTGAKGVRLDAVKHIQSRYIKTWLDAMRTQQDISAVGEYWSGDGEELYDYLDKTGHTMKLFDVPLHFAFHYASHAGADYDLQTLFKGSLSEVAPDAAVAFVDNHDTQPGQSLESWVSAWFKPFAYSCILLRHRTDACIFYTDLYGSQHPGCEAVRELGLILDLRSKMDGAAGTDYFDDPHCVGWTDPSGLAVIFSNHENHFKKMHVGSNYAGAEWHDYLGNVTEPVVIDTEGNGMFPVKGKKLSLYTPRRNAQ